MGETRLRKRYTTHSSHRIRHIGPKAATVVFLLLIACLFGSYIKHNQHVYLTQVSALQKKLAYDQSNGIATDKLRPLQNHLSALKQDRIGPFPVRWFPRLGGATHQLKQLQKQSKTMWSDALTVKENQALAALSHLKKTEGTNFSGEKKQYETALQKAHTPLSYANLTKKWTTERKNWLVEKKKALTAMSNLQKTEGAHFNSKRTQKALKKVHAPQDYTNLAKKWTGERKNWLEQEAKLKKISGGWTDQHPADIVQQENKLADLLKELSSHPSDAKKGNEVQTQAKQYLQMTPSEQIKQHAEIKGKLQSTITTLKQDEAPPVSANQWLFNDDITNYISARAGRVSMAVYDEKNGHIYLYHPDLRFDTASIVKASIMADLLYKSEKSGHSLTEQEKSLMVPMIEKSSNSAATALWNKAGGAKGIETILDQAGMAQTVPGQDGEWGLTKTSALDQVKLMRLFAYPNSVLGTAQREYGLHLMENITSWENWGVSNGIPAAATVALKNGWLPYPAKWWINSIGYVSGAGRNYVIAVLTGGNPSEKYGIQTIDQLSDMIWSQLGGQ